MPQKYYAVRQGRTPGIYESWPDCQAQTNGFKRALFKSFSSLSEAQSWMGDQPSNQSNNQSNARSNNQSNRHSRSSNQHYDAPPSYSQASHAPPPYQSQPASHEDDGDSPMYTHYMPGGMCYGQAGWHTGGPQDDLDYSPLHLGFEEEVSLPVSRNQPRRAQATRYQSNNQSNHHSNNEPVDPNPPRKIFPRGRQPAESTIHWLFTDGGSRSNPGQAGCGGVILSPGSAQPVAEFKHYLGNSVTNNIAEYEGLIRGLEYAVGTLGISALRIRADSQLIVSQSKGDWRVNTPHLQGLVDRSQALLDSLDWWEIEQVPRAMNKHADRMSNEAIDQRSNKVLIRYDLNQSKKRSSSTFEQDNYQGSSKRQTNTRGY